MENFTPQKKFLRSASFVMEYLVQRSIFYHAGNLKTEVFFIFLSKILSAFSKWYLKK